jgi:hypothetical protein
VEEASSPGVRDPPLERRTPVAKRGPTKSWPGAPAHGARCGGTLRRPWLLFRDDVRLWPADGGADEPLLLLYWRASSGECSGGPISPGCCGGGIGPGCGGGIG